MRTIVIGLDEKPLVPWTSNHNRSELRLKVSQLDLQVSDGTQRIEFKSTEISEYIRWDVALRLPFRREK